MSKFIPIIGFKWFKLNYKKFNPKKFKLTKYTSNSSKGCILKLILNSQRNYENYTMSIL